MSSYVRRVFGGLTRTWGRTPVTVVSRSLGYVYAEQPREMFEVLRAYYEGNGVYDALCAALLALGHQDEALKAVRNPATRVVEFYAAKLWPGALPGALPIETTHEEIVEPIHQVWRWSNWGAQKQVFARWLAMYGNVLVKVTPSPTGRVYFRLIDPRYVVDLEEDDRSIVTRVRFDIPLADEVTFTELWTPVGVQTWTHTVGYGADVAQLGQPDVSRSFEEMGIDFVPVVHAKHRDVGGVWGAGAYQLSLDKIDEVNRQASRLYRMLFRHNKNLWVLRANQVDPSGRPLPAPRLNSDGTDELEVGDDTVARLPGNSELQSLVPDLHYEQALAVLVDCLRELEQDLPEMAYYRVYEAHGELSGRALRLMLTAAIDRVVEARGNAEAALARANMMALTLGQTVGLWPGLGAYKAGDFEHVFAVRPVIALTLQERAALVREHTQAGIPLGSAMRLAGYGAEEVADVLADVAATRAAEQVSLAQALARAERDFDRG